MTTLSCDYFLIEEQNHCNVYIDKHLCLDIEILKGSNLFKEGGF